MAGVSRPRLEDETGNGWMEGLHPGDRDLCIETYLKSFNARQRFRIEYRMMGANGDYAWLESVGSPVSRCGDFAGFIGSATDTGARRQAFFTPDDDSVRLVLSLTERERQVLVLIADGRSTKEAAADGNQLQNSRFASQPDS